MLRIAPNNEGKKTLPSLATAGFFLDAQEVLRPYSDATLTKFDAMKAGVSGAR